METNSKNTEYVNNQVLKYYEKTSQHLFLRNNSTFVKLLTIEDKYIVQLIFNNSKVEAYIRKVDKFSSYSDVSSLLDLGKDNSAAKVATYYAKRCDTFPKYNGPYKSIKNFKLMKENIEKVKDVINDHLNEINNGKFSLSSKLDFLKEIKLKIE